MISPTVGRVVWIRQRDGAVSVTQPEVALITFVHSDSRINVAGFSALGEPFALEKCLLVQDGEALPGGRPYAEWMPYQKGQAAKTEALERAQAERAA
jgi:hypothetical protein